MADGTAHHESVGGGSPYQSEQLGGSAPAFLFVLVLAVLALAGNALMWASKGFWLVGLLDTAVLACVVFLLLWPNLVRGRMTVRCGDEGMRIRFGPLGGREVFLPYSAIGAARPVDACGRRLATPKEGVFCPCGFGDTPGVRLELREPWGRRKLDSLAIAVPDYQRLAGFLRERIGGVEA
jgi:hypothetical protein